MRVIYFIVGFWVSYLVFKYGISPGLKWLGNGSDVTVGMSTRPWPDKIILANEVALETPFKLTPTDLEVPKEQRNLISSFATYSYERRDLSILASTISYQPGVTFNLDAAADGALVGMRGVPGTKSVNSVMRKMVVLGDGGMEIEALIVRRGETMEMHGLFFLRQRRMYQLIFITPVNQNERIATWDRMKSGMCFVNPPKPINRIQDLTTLPASSPEGARGASTLPPGMRRRTDVGAKPTLSGAGK